MSVQTPERRSQAQAEGVVVPQALIDVSIIAIEQALSAADVEARPWRPFATEPGVREKVLWEDETLRLVRGHPRARARDEDPRALPRGARAPPVCAFRELRARRLPASTRTRRIRVRTGRGVARDRPGRGRWVPHVLRATWRDRGNGSDGVADGTWASGCSRPPKDPPRRHGRADRRRRRREAPSPFAEANAGTFRRDRRAEAVEVVQEEREFHPGDPRSGTDCCASSSRASLP